MDLSVIIVSYNVRYFLEQCLLSVRRASENLECEVFVVDNNSADGSCSMVSREFPEMILIINNENRGFSAANNQALKIASGRYILLLNPDTIVDENTFKSCINFMDSHPDAGATGVRMINGKGKLLPESKRALPTPRTAFFKMSGLSYLFPRSRFFNRYYLGHLDSLETTKADIISGAFMFLRSESVRNTGLLDEEFFMYGEDVDYSYRLQKAGYNNYYFPEVKIIHYKGESTRKENLNTVVNFYKAMLIFVRKHFSNGSMKRFIHFIQAAIFLTAGISLMRKSFRRTLLPLKLLKSRIAEHPLAPSRRTVIVSDQQGFSRILDLLSSTGARNIISGRVSITEDDHSEEVLGNLPKLKEVLRVNRIREVIFTTRDINTSQIINAMHQISDYKITIRIASADEKYLLGSSYISPDDPVKPNIESNFGKRD